MRETWGAGPGSPYAAGLHLWGGGILTQSTLSPPPLPDLDAPTSDFTHPPPLWGNLTFFHGKLFTIQNFSN